MAENYDDFDPTSLGTIGDMSDISLDRVAAMQYDGLSNQTRLIAYNGSSGNDQNTLYLFEDSVSGNRVTNTIYPDSADTDSTGTDQIEIVYNVDGSLVSRTDQRGTVIAFSYDVLRRQKSQKVTNLGGATDGNIRSITRGYDSLGRLVKITSHNDQTDDPDDTSDVENQIVYTFDAFGRMIKSEQSHDGVVSSSPSVQYAYDASQSGSVFNNGYRLQSITYPNGRVLFTDFGSADTLHDRLSSAYRLRETDGSGTILAEYSRMGSGQIVLTDYPVPDLLQDLYQGTSQTYAALDRFGRTVDHRWYKYTSGTVDIARYSHTYDADGNRLTTEDPVAAAAMFNNDEKYAFDGLNRLTGFDRGNLSMGSIASNTFGQTYGLDQLNNWASFTEDDDGDSMDEIDQDRTHNDANEITGIDSSSTHVAHDAAGNMSKVPVPGNWAAHYDLTWDAWNRLVKVVDGMDTVAEYEYDGLNRRIVKAVYAGGMLDETQHHYLSEQNQVLEVRIDSDPDPLKQFTWGDRYIDDLVLRTRDTDLSGSIDETLYAVQEANWDITAVTNASGTVQERFLYDPYGKSIVLDDNFTLDSDNTSDTNWEYRFTSREFDSETGLHYFRARYYHDRLGRLSSRDELHYVEGHNLFAAFFVPGWVDPSGNISVKLDRSSIERYGDGGYSAKWAFSLEQPAAADGFMVQKETRTEVVFECDGTLISDPKPYIYYEAWQVSKGNKRPDGDQAFGYTDGTFTITDYYTQYGQVCTYGTIRQEGEIQFLLANDASDVSGWASGGVIEAGLLPSSYSKPNAWGKYLNNRPGNLDVEMPAKRVVQIKWNSCLGSDSYDVIQFGPN